MTSDPAGAVSLPLWQVSVGLVRNLLARIVTLPATPARWLSDLMDEADDLWDLVDDDEVGCIS